MNLESRILHGAKHSIKYERAVKMVSGAQGFRGLPIQRPTFEIVFEEIHKTEKFKTSKRDT